MLVTSYAHWWSDGAPAAASAEGSLWSGPGETSQPKLTCLLLRGRQSCCQLILRYEVTWTQSAQPHLGLCAWGTPEGLHIVQIWFHPPNPSSKDLAFLTMCWWTPLPPLFTVVPVKAFLWHLSTEQCPCGPSLSPQVTLQGKKMGMSWVLSWVNFSHWCERSWCTLNALHLTCPVLPCCLSHVSCVLSHFTGSKDSSSWVSQGSDSSLSLHCLAGRERVRDGTFSAEEFPSKSQCLIPDLRGTLPQIISVPSAYWHIALFCTGIFCKASLTCFARSKCHPWLRNFFCII